MARRLALLCCLLCPGAAAFAQGYPPGHSVQTYEGRTFELLLPDDFDASKSKSYSLVVMVERGRDVTQKLAHLAADGYILCAPKPQSKSTKAGWATSEAKDIHELVAHLVKVLPIDSGRLHAIGLDDWEGFFPHVAFRKRGNRFVSVCFYKVAYRGGSLPPRARKEMGLLVLGDDDKFDEEREVDTLRSKVRSIEYRPNDTIDSPYVHYWLGVMEGRFEPGRDLSFDWRTDEAQARKEIAASERGGLVYFYSEKDTDSHVQNVVFFDETVRRIGRKLTALKLDRAKHEKLFNSFGLKSTPAVVVVDTTFKARKNFEGKIKAAALAKELKRVG